MNYAVITDGIVQEIIPEFAAFDGVQVHISHRYHPDFIAALVTVPDDQVATLGGSYADGIFGPVPVAPAPTTEQILAQRDALLAIAAVRIAPLQDAVDLEEATATEIALLKKWKQYRVALNRIQDQVGFPTAVDWPVAPD